MLEMFRLENAMDFDDKGDRLPQIETYLNSHDSHNSLFEMAFKINKLNRIFLNINGKYTSVKPVVHSFLGGVCVNEYAESSVKGLFACGEVVGGLNGASRLAATAFPEAVILGQLTGEKAPEYLIETSEKEHFEILGKVPDSSFEKVNVFIDNICKILDENLFIKKNRLEMEKLLKILPKVHTLPEDNDNPKKVDEILLNNQILTIKAIIKSALKRTESRGAFYREDFPDSNRSFDQNISVRMKNNNFVINFI
jgi:aspartate oxidase